MNGKLFSIQLRRNLIRVLLLSLTAASPVAAQICKLSRNDLIAICTDNKGMIHPNGYEIYAIVRLDGIMEYLDITNGRESIKREKLHQDQLDVIRTLLTDPELETLGGVVKATDGTPLVDFHTRLELFLASSGRTRRIIFEDFYPTVGRKFPKSITAILCAVDKYKVSQYSLSSGCS